jgi:PTH1 family peptidyl-tRNA hydrolase
VDLRLIVGLGNPGRRYADTRHNVGFRVADGLARRWTRKRERRAYHSWVREFDMRGFPLVLLKPRTYMNLSGEAVLACRDARRVEGERTLVVCDDLNLPLGKIRIRRQGSSGGHKGLQSIIDCLGTESFARLRVGIGDPGDEDSERFVLDPFRPEETGPMDDAVERAADAVESWVLSGIDEAMGDYNG